MCLSIEELTDIPLSAWREQLRLEAHQESQRQIQADAAWLARQEAEIEVAA